MNKRRVRIDTLYHGLYDGPHATPKPSIAGPIYLGIGNVTDDGKLDLADVRHIAEEDYELWTKRVVPQPGDIVFTYEATLNRYAIIPPGFRGCLGRRTALIRPNDRQVNPRFLFFYLFSDDWRRTVQKNIMSGVTVDRIPLTLFPAFTVDLPDRRTQDWIVSILSAYDDLIENNTRRIKILEEMAQMIYREWFVKFRFPGHENVRMVESELGPIPECWRAPQLEQILDHAIGGGWGEELRSDEFPVPAYVIRGTDIPGARHGAIADCPLRWHKESNFRSRKLQSDDLVFEVSGGSKGQPVGRSLLVGPTLLSQFDEDLICASFCKLLRPKIGLSAVLFCFLREAYTNGVIEKYQVQSTGISNFKFTAFVNEVRIPMPPRSIVSQFTDVTATVLEAIAVHGKRNANLRATRDFLLPKLVSGEVPLDAADETAEHLMEATA